MRKRHRRSGFTLVEALAAGVLLALAAGVLSMIVSRSYAALVEARDYRRAAALLDELATKVDLIGPARLMDEGPSQGRFDPPLDRFAWEAQVAPEYAGSLYRVTLRVSWPTGNGERRAELETLLNDPPQSRNPLLEWDDL